MGAEALLSLVSADLAWCEWSVNSLASGKCLQNLENVYFQAFSSYLGAHTAAKSYQGIGGIPCSNEMHQIGLGRLISVEMLQVQVAVLGKQRVIVLL